LLLAPDHSLEKMNGERSWGKKSTNNIGQFWKTILKHWLLILACIVKDIFEACKGEK